MNQPGANATPSARTLSHDQAESLISERLDGPLDPIDSRDLLVHLSSCQSCTAFAVQMEVMARELESLPQLPASPTVSRQVRETIYAEPSMWDRITGALSPGGWSAMPIAVAALALLISVSAILMLRDDQGEVSTIAPAAIDAPSEVALADTAPTSTAATSDSVPTISQERTGPTPTVRVIQSPTPDTELAAIDSSRYDGSDTPTADSAAGLFNETPTRSAGLADADIEPIGTTGIITPVTVQKSPTGAESTSTSLPESTSTARDAVLAAAADGTIDAVSETQAATKAATVVSPEESPTPTGTVPPTEEPTLPATEIPEPVATATATITATATETAETAVPEVEPQPTIAPAGGGAAIATTDSSAESSATGSSPDIESSTSDAVSEDGNDSKIVPTDGSQAEPAAETATAEAEQSIGGAIQEAGGQPGLLDNAPVVATLPPGTAAPTGRLEFRPQLDLYVVTLADGQLAVANTAGTIVAGLGAGVLPIWSPAGGVLLFQQLTGSTPGVAVWDGDTGSVFSIGAPADGTVVDTPAGWQGTRLYYQRTFPDQPGLIELHSANWDGSDDVVVWRAEGITPISERPVAFNGGFIIADASNWLIVYADGGQVTVGPQVFGSVGAPILSPGGSLIAYDADGGVYVAPVDNPGSPLGSPISFSGGSGSGYAFATSGEQIAVSQPGGFGLFDIYGGALGQAFGSNPLSAPYWIQDQVYFLDISSATSLKVASAREIIASGS